MKEPSDEVLRTRLAGWRERALSERVQEELLTPTGRLLNYHGRVVPRSLDEVWDRLSKMGTLFDDVWPMPRVPRKNEGPLAAGMRSGHGTIRYEFVEISQDKVIEWRFTMDFLRGRDTYRAHAVEHGTYVETLIDGHLLGDLLDVWRTGPGPMHDWVMERILDALETSPAPWFELSLLAKIR